MYSHSLSAAEATPANWMNYKTQLECVHQLQCNMKPNAADCMVVRVSRGANNGNVRKLFRKDQKIQSYKIMCKCESWNLLILPGRLSNGGLPRSMDYQNYTQLASYAGNRDVGVPRKVWPGRGTNDRKTGTSRENRDGWQPYLEPLGLSAKAT
jgi:hypothetical protein